jgi:hypothetical protein
MVMRSASPQSLSDDMLVENVQKSNHVLSLPIGSAFKKEGAAPKNEQVNHIWQIL